MGWEWEVEAYLPVDNSSEFSPAYLWVKVYEGNYQDEADHARLQAAGQGAGAVRTTWRPTS